MPMTHTYTYAALEVSAAAYDEIAEKLRAAEYDHAFHDDGLIDMHGIALDRGEDLPTHHKETVVDRVQTRAPGALDSCASSAKAMTAMDSLTERLDEIKDRARCVGQRLQGFADRMIGSEPKNDCEALADAPNPPGIMQHLDTLISDVGRQ
ncbi:MAG: hypothetical protein WD079_01725, partial [Phycisphaeraceae bacterium]